MSISAAAIKISITAWDTVNQVGKTGLAASTFTLEVAADGADIGAITSSGNITEDGNGEYFVVLTGAQNTGTMMSVRGSNSSTGIIVIPAKWNNLPASGMPETTKTALLPTWPTHFSSMAISAAGIVSANATQFAGQTITCAAGVTINPQVGAANEIATDSNGGIRIGAGFAHGDTGANNTSLALSVETGTAFSMQSFDPHIAVVGISQVGGGTADAVSIICDGGFGIDVQSEQQGFHGDIAGDINGTLIGSVAGDVAGRIIGNSSTAFVDIGVHAAAYDPNGTDNPGTAAIAAYAPAKAGQQMDLINSPNGVALGAIGAENWTYLKAQSLNQGASAGTVEEALVAARAQGLGKWVISGTTLTLYGPDGTTVVKAFTLDSGTNPTQRT